MDIQDYNFAEKSIHNYARILGAIANFYIKSETDYSHSNLSWNDEKKVLETRIIHLPNNFVATIEYHPNHFHFHISTNCPNLKDPLVLSRNNNLNYIIRTFQNNFNLINLDGQGFTVAKLPYPEILQSDVKPLQPTKDAIHLFEKIRTGTNQVLVNYLKEYDLNSEIRIWPHNFDTGIYCKHSNGIEQFAGYAPADSISEFPYYYNSFYKDGKAFLPNFDEQLSFWNWVNSNWKGAIYPLGNPNEVDFFLSNGIHFFKQTTNKFLNINTF
ncbi:MAG: hypothetical protein K2P85_13240 [Flavobacteriaceae bacterium]|jgi:hypothetical protein|nr:hypothetical protein [Flavobacteriaceae bacterium]